MEILPNAAQVVERLRENGAPRPLAEQLVVIAKGAEVARAGRFRAPQESDPPVPAGAWPLARWSVLAQHLRARGRAESVAIGELGSPPIQVPTRRGADVEPLAEARICSREEEEDRARGAGCRHRRAPVSPPPEW